MIRQKANLSRLTVVRKSINGSIRTDNGLLFSIEFVKLFIHLVTDALSGSLDSNQALH